MRQEASGQCRCIHLSHVYFSSMTKFNLCHVYFLALPSVMSCVLSDVTGRPVALPRAFLRRVLFELFVGRFYLTIISFDFTVCYYFCRVFLGWHSGKLIFAVCPMKISQQSRRHTTNICFPVVSRLLYLTNYYCTKIVRLEHHI